MVLGEAANILLRPDQVAVGEHVELAPTARRDGGRCVGPGVDLGRETRGACVVAASGGAEQDLDLHGVKPNDASLAPVEPTVFEVEQAGCESCAALVRDALEDVATVLDVRVDESADLATVRLAEGTSLAEDDVDRLLREASPEGHAYRVRPGSWRVA